jgi:hypothetical protein
MKRVPGARSIQKANRAIVVKCHRKVKRGADCSARLRIDSLSTSAFSFVAALLFFDAAPS